jgi:hypothetical protein
MAGENLSRIPERILADRGSGAPRSAVGANYENGPDLKAARARVGTLAEMKRNKSLLPRQFKGFQPLRSKWQP